jgi:hypothetical protein
VPLCEGYLINRISYSQIEESDSLEVGLRWGPDRPDVRFWFSEIYYFATEGIPGPGAEPVDRVIASILAPSDESWPDDLPLNLVRSSSLPPLIWVRMEKPLVFNIVAQVASVAIEVQ